MVPFSISSPLFYRVGGERGGGAPLLLFSLDFLSIMVSIAENNGSISISIPLFYRVGGMGGGGAP